MFSCGFGVGLQSGSVSVLTLSGSLSLPLGLAPSGTPRPGCRLPAAFNSIRAIATANPASCESKQGQANHALRSSGRWLRRIVSPSVV